MDGHPSALSGHKLLTLFVEDHQGIHGADGAGIHNPLALNVRWMLFEGTDIVSIEFEEVRRHLHAVRGADAQGTIDADRHATHYPFDKVSDDRPSSFAMPVRASSPARAHRVTGRRAGRQVSQETQLKLCRLGHFGRVPGRFEDHLHRRVLHAGNRLHPLANLHR